MRPSQDLSKVISPALLFDIDRINANLEAMVELVGGDPARLRPHIKTHKCSKILELQLERGIQCVKCATIAEAELAARTAVPDVLLAYPLVGPNASRFNQLRECYPEIHFSAVVDSHASLEALSIAGKPLSVYLDFDCGMHRTGISSSDSAVSLIEQIQQAKPLEFAGIHVYDGHIHDSAISDRKTAFDLSMSEVDRFVALLQRKGITVATVIAGGSPTFSNHAARALEFPTLWQCSPGTSVLWDHGYGSKFPELPFNPAASLLTRVVSRPTSTLACLDLGHKAVAAENPIEQRIHFPEFPELTFFSHSEEHLVVSLPERLPLSVGTELIGIPYHVCPTVALYDEAWIIRGGTITGNTWAIEGRGRRLTV